MNKCWLNIKPGTVFAVGDKVRCHADCTSDPVVNNCFEGPLTEHHRWGPGWWYMKTNKHPQMLVHEQELEKL